jgi:DNA polymerase I-like protein with 3'-5' exonuclease and polymerase domains
MGKIFGDEAGLIWQTPIKVGRTAAASGARDVTPRTRYRPTPAPPSDYQVPTVFPQIRHAKQIYLDIETFDPHLKEKGAGACRNDGYICGFGVRTDDWEGDYYPVRHKGGPNCDAEKTFQWLGDNLAFFDGELVGSNLLYEGQWLSTEKVHFPNAKIKDILWAEPLLDENQYKYNLEVVARKWVGEGKVTNELKKLYGPDYLTFFPEIHPGHAKPYVMGDINLPREILPLQMEQLKKEGLLSLFALECSLFHPLLYMKMKGVRIDLEAAQRLQETLKAKRKELMSELRAIAGFDVNVNSAEHLARMFDKLGIAYPRTAPTAKKPNGSPSFVKEWLVNHESRAAELATAIRRCEKFDGTFINAYLHDNYKGRMYTEFHPLKRTEEDGGGTNGTVSGRFSSSNPNLQNIPIRDDIYGPLMRALFIPDEGMDWWSLDQSQMEYRFLVHFAVAAKAPGAVDAQLQYQQDRSTDFHKLAAALTGLERKHAKNINFGIVYGMGVPTMTHKLGCGKDKAKEILDTYHQRMPFARATYKLASQRAQSVGFIRTIYGRKRRYDLWEPAKFNADPSKRDKALPRDLALQAYGNNIKRAFTHSALNQVLQGSNADYTKKCMADAWYAGLVGPKSNLSMVLTVHDEIDGSCPKTPEAKESLEELRQMMMRAIPLNVPVLVEGGTGKNWAEAH